MGGFTEDTVKPAFLAISGDSRGGRRPTPFGRAGRWESLLVFAACVLLYTLTNYGGIRSPDNEVVFRAALSFADHGRLDVGRSLEDWPGFGTALARDGRQYPVFGPVQSLALSPWIVLGQGLLPARQDPATRLPVSFYVPGGLLTALYSAPPSHLEAHALRCFCSFLNVIVSALAVAVFHRVLRRLQVSRFAAGITAAFLGAGSLVWPYAGTFFSEPLALLFLLLAFHGLLDFEPVPVGRSELRPGRTFAAGLSLGVAVATHVSAALFLPFLAWIPLASARARTSPPPEARERQRAALVWLAGLLCSLVALGLYNLGRFGSPLETGRGVSPEAAYEFGYGTWTTPWRAIYGLLASPGKGLLLTCPAVLLGILAWPAWHRKHRRLSFVLAAAALTRLLVLSARSDWHGGFCLGPRYLLMLLPFLLLPIGPWIDAGRARSRRLLLPGVGAFLLLCVSQQFWFGLGEIFRFYHRAARRAENAGIDPFAGDGIYLRSNLAPLTELADGGRGPFLLGGVDLGPVTLWLIGSALAAGIIAGAILLARPRVAVRAEH